MSNFHGRIMNIPAKGQYGGEGYYEGHRDARHAAADIANEADAEIARLRDALQEIVTFGASNFEYGDKCAEMAEAALRTPDMTSDVGHMAGKGGQS